MKNVSYVVKTASPARRFTGVLVAILVTTLMFGLAYYQGREQLKREQASLLLEREAMDFSHQQLSQDGDVLRERLAILERTRQVERRAYLEVEYSLKELQNEILSLKKELAFYRSIVAGKDGHKGLNIESFDLLSKTVGGRDFRYRLVLTQLVKNDKVIRGKVSLTIHGEQDGKSKTLALLGPSGQKPVFGFKYFQTLEGDISLPDGFSPRRVSVLAVPKGKTGKKKAVERNYDWPELVG